MDLSRISKKNPHEDSRMTLAAIDKKTMENFNNYYDQLPEKQKLLQQYIRRKNNCRNKYSDEYHEYNHKIKELQEEIYNMENRTHQLNYLIKASTHFLEYSLQNNSATLLPNVSPIIKPVRYENEDNEEEFNDENEEENFITKKDITNRGKICQEYIKECIGDGYSLSTKSNECEISNELTCKNCGIEKLTNPRESYASCPNCGEVTKYQDIHNNKGEYSDEVEVLSPFAYKRINHFKEWISKLIAREGSGIPQEVIDKLLKELKQDKVEKREEVTEERIKGYLKKLKYSKLYEHIPAIIYKICGVEPPKISAKLEAKLIEMFQQIQAPFEMYAPKTRTNFLSYAFCIHKMLQLLKQDHLLDKLPLLKSREKLYQQDQIWKGVCKENKWKYIPSI